MQFIVTEELGRLSKWLRALGFDTEYYTQGNRSGLVLTSLKEDRVILTRNIKLTGRANLRLVHIKSDFVDEQLKEVIKTLNLNIDKAKIFTRCILCNSILKETEKERVKECIPEYIYATCDKFYRCDNCNKVYWQGSHYEKAMEFVKKLEVTN